MKEPGRTERAPAPVGHYSQSCTAGDMVFVSGQGPLDPATGKLCSPDIAEQTRHTLFNTKNLLKSMHATMQNVVKTTVILLDMKDVAAMSEVTRSSSLSRIRRASASAASCSSRHASGGRRDGRDRQVALGVA